MNRSTDLEPSAEDTIVVAKTIVASVNRVVAVLVRLFFLLLRCVISLPNMKIMDKRIPPSLIERRMQSLPIRAEERFISNMIESAECLCSFLLHKAVALLHY